MTPAQLKEWRDKIAASRQPVQSRALGYEFPRGWNEALDHVERLRREVMGESEPKKDAAP